MQLKRNNKTGRNELCSCGSKMKYKKCCLLKQQRIIKETEDACKSQRNEEKD